MGFRRFGVSGGSGLISRIDTVSLHEGIAIGIFAGILAVFIEIHKFRYVPAKRRPGWLTSWFYWTLTAGRVLLGGIAVWIYVRLGYPLDFKACLYLGFTAPLSVAALISGSQGEPGTTD